jgi:hypothetical protein
MLPSCTQLLFVSQEPILCQQLYPPLHLGSSLCSLSMPKLHIRKCKYKLLLKNQKKSQQDIKLNLYRITCPTSMLFWRSTVQEPGRKSWSHPHMNRSATGPFGLKDPTAHAHSHSDEVRTSLSRVWLEIPGHTPRPNGGATGTALERPQRIRKDNLTRINSETPKFLS